ncbi:O-antigen ligase family protein [Thermomonas sp.]|uniref:O-antigen ligase family protein n=1 Tax=Thermomonas sp. TaxID=1971895 RepID=UPI0035AECBF1
MTDVARRLLLPALILLLVACWLGGGVTSDDTGIDEGLQLLALPVLLLAAATLLDETPSPWVRRGLWVAAAIAMVPAVQLLPIPAALWHLPPARQALAADIAVAGVTVAPHWSLTPAASERALWALLPAMAAFLAACALTAVQRRRLLQALVGLVAFNVVFAFFQAGLPQESDLRLYQDFDAGFGGLLANTNHQATACIIGMALAVGLAAESRLRAVRGQAHPHRHWWYWGLATGFLLMVPLSTSRAGMSIVLPVLALALWLTRVLKLRQIGRSRRATALALGLVVLSVVGARAAIGWLAVDQAEEIRHTLAAAAVAMGKAEAPLGSGMGSFVPAFEQAAPASLQMANYVNHAHNEYAQWWMTAGWLGMLALAAALLLLVAAGWQIARAHGRNAVLAGASLAALCAVLAHSWADYPLRTLTLMATCGALAGVLLAALGDMSQARQAAETANDTPEEAQPL